MTRRFFRALSIALTLLLLAAACGDSETTDASPTTTSSAEEPATTLAEPPDSSTTLAPTTTTTEAPTPAIETDDIPGLIEAWATGTAPALELAQAIIGFPIEVAPASDGGAYSLSVDMDGTDETLDWGWEWRYEAIAADPIGEIDIDLDDNGAGSVALRDHYEPILNALGWSYSNSTGSDPSSGGGGPQSMNHVFQNDTGTMSIGGVEATTNPLFVWAQEDIDFRDGPDVPGYRINLSVESEPGFIPVPMLAALYQELPEVPGARLVEASLRSRDRQEDSYDAEFGLRYFELEFTLELAADSVDAARDAFSAGLTGSVYQAGDESFFEPGIIEFAEPRITDDSWNQAIVALDRYPGEIVVETDAATGDAEASVRIRLEPNRVELVPDEE